MERLWGDMVPKPGKGGLCISLIEPFVFLRGSISPSMIGRRSNPQVQPAMVRGLLTLTLDKPMKISSIDIVFDGKTRTNWLDGLGPRRIDVTEEHQVFSVSTTCFRADSGRESQSRRTASVGPGLHFDREEEMWDDPGSNNEVHRRRYSQVFDSSDRRRITMDSRFPVLCVQDPLDMVPTPPYSPLHSRLGSVLEHEERQVAVTPADRQAFDSLPLPVISLETSRSTSQHTYHGDMPTRDASLGHSSRSSLQSLFRSDISRSESVDDPVRIDVSRGRTRLQAARPVSYSGPTTSCPPSLARISSTTPVSPPQSPPSNSPHSQHSTNGTFYYSNLPDDRQHSRSSSRLASHERSRDRGRHRHPMFGLASVSNALFDAVRHRVRSSSRAEKGAMRSSASASRDHSPDGGSMHHYRRPPSILRRFGNNAETEAERGRSRTQRDDEAVRHSGRENEQPTLERMDNAPGLNADKAHANGESWKEFRKGTYTYPISFAIPGDLPPTLQCEYGSVAYRLKAIVHRPGKFVQKLTLSRDVILIASPGEDDLEESDSIVIQRDWDSQMHYLVMISGRAFPIGSSIPIQMMFMPIAKLKIYRISIFLEERIEYLSQFKTVVRSEVVMQHDLLSLKGSKIDEPLLPLSTEYAKSPLHNYVEAADESEAASSIMGPGPWNLHATLQLPQSCSKLHFTNKHKRSNIAITHVLKVIFRVEPGDQPHVNPNTGLGNLLDVVIQSPIHILSCQCNPEFTLLPRYSSMGSITPFSPLACPCEQRRGQSNGGTEPHRSVIAPAEPSCTSTPNSAIQSGHGHHRYRMPFLSLFHHGGDPTRKHEAPAPMCVSPSISIVSSGPSGHGHGVNGNYQSCTPTSTRSSHNSGEHLANTSGNEHAPEQLDSETSQRNSLFARLLSGEESEMGEAPPRYDLVASLENDRGTLASAAVFPTHS